MEARKIVPISLCEYWFHAAFPVINVGLKCPIDVVVKEIDDLYVYVHSPPSLQSHKPRYVSGM